MRKSVLFPAALRALDAAGFRSTRSDRGREIVELRASPSDQIFICDLETRFYVREASVGQLKWVVFPDESVWYLAPHDFLCAIANKAGKIPWDTCGGVYHRPTLSHAQTTSLAPYIANSRHPLLVGRPTEKRIILPVGSPLDKSHEKHNSSTLPKAVDPFPVVPLSSTANVDMEKLKNAWSLIRDRFPQLVDEFPAVAAIEAHRAYWRPARIRTLLIAESHVFTRADHLAVKVNYPSLVQPKPPSELVGLVYCLGYGEPGILGRATDLKGTPQFWKLFAAMINDPDDKDFAASVLSSRTIDKVTRIKNKIELLSKLRDAGVWLVDASIVALYQSGGSKPDPQVRKEVLQLGWDLYVRDNALSRGNPERVIIIGRGVARALSERLNKDFNTEWSHIPQPQARESSETHQEGLRHLYNATHDK